MGVITGFNRRRDSYQLPLAFAEHGALDAFVTDYYHGAGPFTLERLSHRRAEGLPASVVRTSPTAWAMQLGWEFRRRFTANAIFPSARVDAAVGRAIAREARARPVSDLFVYSGYALESFERRDRPNRLLFQFHPTKAIIAESLADDDLAAARPWLQELEFHPDYAESKRAVGELSAATGVVVASTTTKRGLVLDGVAGETIDVVPYGCDPAEQPPVVVPSKRIRFLFVGQGTQRKGLHTLLTAWREAKLPDAELVAVCLRIDPEIAALAEGLDSVTIHPALPWAELEQQYTAADTLVVPSLLEGFGLVLLEGLSRGTRLIASTNTGAVDLDLAEDVCSIVPAGRVEPLVEALRRSAASYRPERPYAEHAWEASKRWTWARFRRGVREAAGYA